MKAELKVVETRVIRHTSYKYKAHIEYVSMLLVDGVVIPTEEPIVVTKELTDAQSELLDLLLQEEKGEA